MYHAKLVLTHICAIDNAVGYCCDISTIYLSNEINGTANL